MPFEPREPPHRPVLPVPVDLTGRRGPTPGQARGPRWRRTGRNAYVPAGVDPSLPEQRIAEAALALTPEGGVTAWGGLVMAGAGYFRDHVEREPVVLALGPVTGRRRHPKTQLSYEPLDCPRHDVLGIPILPPVRSLADEVRRLDDWRERVVAADMTFAAGVSSLRRLRQWYTGHRSWRRSTVLPQVLDHASEHARSPQETRLRLVWTEDAGLPPPLLNRTLRTRDGRFICIPDLFDEEAGLVVEYDGEDHAGSRRRSSDASRHDRCRDAGLEYCVITAPDMHTVAGLVARLRAARQRAAFAQHEHRGWVVAPRKERTLDDVLDERERSATEIWRRHGVRVSPW